MLAILCVGGAVTLGSSHLWARHHESAAEFAAKIHRERNPIKKARLEIRLARLDLQQASDAYGRNHARQGQALLADYLKEVNSSWRLLQSTGRNAAKKPEGFMQLEIALRENARTLRDLQDRVYYRYQGSISTLEKEVNQLHSKVLLALFPGASPPAAGAQNRKAAGSLPVKESHP